MFVRDDLRPVQRRTVALLAAVAVLFALFAARLWVLQVLQGARWRQVAESNRLRRVPLEAPRGTVTDLRGDVILDNRPTYQLLLFPEEMKDQARAEAFLATMGIADDAEVRARVNKARRTSHLPSIIADNLTWPQVAAIAAHRIDFPELEVHPASRRSLPYGAMVAHLVGQLGEVSPEQIAENPALRPGQLVGRSGLERSYQDTLGGVPGNLVVVVDAFGKQVSSLAEERPVPGRPLAITLDMVLQREAAAAMAGQVGAVVAVDPRDGAVRVLLSEPAFDPDLFAGHLEPIRWQELSSDPLRPLTNRALQALYPPGSTIKPIFAAGALHDRVRSVGSSVTCTGAVSIYGHPYRCWLKGGHGTVSLVEAIEVSCDSFFYHLAHDAGLDALARWAHTAGLGSVTGIELPGESSGLVPSDEWSRKARGHPWYGGETISVGIGQGPILVTPIQMAAAYAALVNGGLLFRPHLVEGQGAPGVPLGYSAETLAAVRRGMELVVRGDRGTARRLGSLPIAFGGKTGTSQVIAKQEGVKWQDLPWEQRHHAMFIGFAPASAPQLVVAVVVEHGGDASSVAAPIAARILQKAFGAAIDTAAITASVPPGPRSLPAEPQTDAVAPEPPAPAPTSPAPMTAPKPSGTGAAAEAGTASRATTR